MKSNLLGGQRNQNQWAAQGALAPAPSGDLGRPPMLRWRGQPDVGCSSMFEVKGG
jgi:hypothetical protein